MYGIFFTLFPTFRNLIAKKLVKQQKCFALLIMMKVISPMVIDHNQLAILF